MAPDTILAHYEAARDEVIIRIRLRDHVLLVYLAAVGAFFGVALGAPNAKPELVLAIPFIALGAITLVSQHNAVIGALLSFSNKELKPSLKNMGAYAPQWESSNALRDYYKSSLRLRYVGHTVIILVPCAGALIFNINHILSPFPEGVVWWFGLISGLISLWLIARVNQARMDYYQSADWDK